MGLILLFPHFTSLSVSVSMYKADQFFLLVLKEWPDLEDVLWSPEPSVPGLIPVWAMSALFLQLGHNCCRHAGR